MAVIRETGVSSPNGRYAATNAEAGAVSGPPSGLTPAIAGIRRARIALDRRLRRFAYWAIRSGLAARFAAGLSMLDRRRGLYLRGWLASIRYRHDDHTDFWNEAAGRFPADAALVRNMAHAALRAGRIVDAEAALSWLIDRGTASADDSRFIVGLTNIDAGRGDTAHIRLRLRRFLGSLRRSPDRRIAALRLSRIIFAHFSRATDRNYPLSCFRPRFLNMLAHSDSCPGPRNLLLRVAACEARLECAFPRSLLDTDVSASQRAAFISLVRRQLAAGEGFSFVRIGDGEAACLPYEPRLAVHALADARDRERIWWGRPLPDPVRAWLAPRVARAMWDADCIGIPTIPRFLRELRLDEPHALETSLTGRGLRAILHCMERVAELRSPDLPPPMFTSCHLHQDLALWNCYGTILDGAREVLLISCHPALADFVADKFGARIAGSLVLPPDGVSGPLVGRRSAKGDDLPRILGTVTEQMGELPRGRLVLVGAGYPGKILLRVAGDRGGVALDLGSVFDYWLGLKTRTYMDMPQV